MVRPRKSRLINFIPKKRKFMPNCKQTNNDIVLTFDEAEALRLSDLEKLTQTQAARLMGLHQSTFCRTLACARKKIADAIINGKAIKINGGAYKMVNQVFQGQGRGQGRGLGRGLGRGQGLGPGGNCKCPKCGAVVPHQPGVPCTKLKCPECGTIMMRES